MLTKVTRLERLGGFRLRVRFNDGSEGVYDFAAMVNELGASAVGAAGLSDVGAVVGATAPDRLERLRELMPAAVFLLPGVGAQGGRVEDLAPAFAPGPAGGLVAVSRGIVAALTHDKDNLYVTLSARSLHDDFGY